MEKDTQIIWEIIIFVCENTVYKYKRFFINYTLYAYLPASTYILKTPWNMWKQETFGSLQTSKINCFYSTHSKFKNIYNTIGQTYNIYNTIGQTYNIYNTIGQTYNIYNTIGQTDLK